MSLDSGSMSLVQVALLQGLRRFVGNQPKKTPLTVSAGWPDRSGRRWANSGQRAHPWMKTPPCRFAPGSHGARQAPSAAIRAGCDTRWLAGSAAAQPVSELADWLAG